MSAKKSLVFAEVVDVLTPKALINANVQLVMNYLQIKIRARTLMNVLDLAEYVLMEFAKT